MKKITIMFLFLFLCIIAMVSSQCTVVTEVVPVSDVDSIVLQPYTCAAVGGAHWYGAAESKMVTDPNGGIAFIICKLLDNKNMDWQCYAKVDAPDTFFYVTQPLACAYDVKDNVTMLKVGTCSLHFGLTTYFYTDDSPLERLPYAELSIGDRLSFRPFLNLNAIGAVQRQTGADRVNKIIKVSDTYLDTAFFPPFPETSTLAVLETQLKTLNETVTNFIDLQWNNAICEGCVVAVALAMFFFAFWLGRCTRIIKPEYGTLVVSNQELQSPSPMVFHPIEEHTDPV